MDHPKSPHTEYHPENNPEYKGLKVNAGIEKPPVTNPNPVHKNLRSKRKQLALADYIEGILSGNRMILSRAVTLVESVKPEHQELAQQIILECLPHSGNSTRIGITGVPGAGKSTFIEALGKHITATGNRLAVLAIDPSSERTKGSILGDKTRMEELAADANAYIRPSPSAGSLGGVARKTRETVILCEAAGFNNIFIETVGVGQSETAVHSMVDFFLLLQIAGAGDELQGIKRGIMEMADGIVINKADGNNIERAKLAQAQFRNALHLFPKAQSGWDPQVLSCSSINKTGISEVWQMISDYMNYIKQSNYLNERRIQQSKYWMYETIHEALKNSFYNNTHVKNRLKATEDDVLTEKMSSFVAAKELLNLYFKNQ